MDGEYPDPSLIIRWPVIVFENRIEEMYYLDWLEERRRKEERYLTLRTAGYGVKNDPC
jgi:hypothetical protein